MSSKAVIKPYKVVDGGDMSSNVVSAVTNVETSDNIAYHVTFTGAPTGAFSVQGTVSGEDWQDLDLGDLPPSAGGSADGFLISLKGLPYAQVRLVYTRTSGSGSLTAWVMGKRLGG